MLCSQLTYKDKMQLVPR